MLIQRYRVTQQGIGEFDGGKITEQKPIGFPGEGSEVKRVGPLFYWAWAKADHEGYIPLHPHQGFEIITYVISGTAEHGDSLGTRSIVGPGGLQVMQTGSGVSHEEGFVGPDMQGFQIWFEPHLRVALRQNPTYQQFEHEEFQIIDNDGVSVKEILGDDSPVSFETDALMWDTVIESEMVFQQSISKGRSLCVLVIEGVGKLNDRVYEAKDYFVIEAKEDNEIKVLAEGKTRFLLIEVPTTVSYSLLRK